MRLLDLGAEPLDHRRCSAPLELLAGELEVDPQRDQALLGAVVQVALDAPPLGVAASTIRARDARSSPSRAPFSTASTVADAAARTSSGSSASASSMHHRGDRPAVPVHRHPARVRRRRRRSSSAPSALPVALRRRVPVAEPQRRVVERGARPRRATLRRRARERAAPAAVRGARAGEQLGLQQRDEEAERQQDAGADEHPAPSVERGRVGSRISREKW